MMILNAFAIFIGLLLLWIDDIYLVFIIRFCQGIAVGLYSMIVPLIIKEICPAKIINRVRAVNYSILALALIIVYSFAYKLSSIYIENTSAGMGWTILCAFPLAILAIQSSIL